MSASSPRPLLYLFTKPARPGRVKTRLIGDLSAREAALLHGAFLGDLLERFLEGHGGQGGRFEVRIAWALDEGEALPESPFPGQRQEGGDLGARLFKALAGGARDGCGSKVGRAVAAVGSDHPTLPVERIEEAFERLEAGAEVVLGPAEDGGYYLIALRPEAIAGPTGERLFEGIAWSTAEVLEQTLDRCRELGLRYELLPPGADVDTPDDLRRLAQELAASGDDLGCPRTRALLDSWGWLAAGVHKSTLARPDVQAGEGSGG